MHIADRSIFLAISRLLWAFHFKRMVDQETGEEVIPDMDDMVDGIMMMPTPFAADIQPRSAEKAECVRNAWAQVLPLLDSQEQWNEVPEGLIWKDEQDLL